MVPARVPVAPDFPGACVDGARRLPDGTFVVTIDVETSPDEACHARRN